MPKQVGGGMTVVVVWAGQVGEQDLALGFKFNAKGTMEALPTAGARRRDIDFTMIFRVTNSTPCPAASDQSPPQDPPRPRHLPDIPDAPPGRHRRRSSEGATQ